MQVTYPYGKPSTEQEVMWKAKVKSYSVVVDYERDVYGTTSYIELTFHPVVRHTTCGVWIREYPSQTEERFVRTNTKSGRQGAYATEMQALKDLLSRKEYQHKRLVSEAQYVQSAIDSIKREINNRFLSVA